MTTATNTAPTMKQYTAQLKRVSKREDTLIAAGQAAIEIALKQYEDHGNASYLTALRRGANGRKLFTASNVHKYIVNHANVEWKRAKSGKEMVYARADGETESVLQPREVDYIDFKAPAAEKTEAELLGEFAKKVKSYADKGLSRAQMSMVISDYFDNLATVASDAAQRAEPLPATVDQEIAEQLEKVA